MNLKNFNTLLPFDDLLTRVRVRAATALPDRVVSVSDLRMNLAGELVLPGDVIYRLNPHALRALASLLGLRWDRWFATATPAERAEEVNRRFTRTPGERKIRAWACEDGSAHGVARALLSPSFTPIDDVRIFERADTLLRGLVTEYRYALTETDQGTFYTAVHERDFDVDGAGDLLRPGFVLRNSEVGAGALTLDDHWLRLVCANGLLVQVGQKRALYRTHRAIDDNVLAAALLIAIGSLPERWKTSFGWLQAARKLDVAHPDVAVEAILGDSAAVPRALREEAKRVVLRDGDRTRYGVVQAITYVAHAVNTDPEVRFTMERLAGAYLAATLV